MERPLLPARAVLYKIESNVHLEAVHLATVGITLYGHFYQPQWGFTFAFDVFCEQDRAGACAHDGHTGASSLNYQIIKTISTHQLADDGALAPRKDQGIDRLKMLVQPNRNRVYATALKVGYVLSIVALERKYAYGSRQFLPASLRKQLLSRDL